MQDPFSDDDDFVRHRESCPACTEEWQKAMVFEKVLRTAMTVAPEKELEAARTSALHARWWQKTWVRTASVLVLLGVTLAGFNIARQMFAVNNLPQLVVHHIQNEP